MKGYQGKSNFEVLRLIRDARSTEGATRGVLNILALGIDPNRDYFCFRSLKTIAEEAQLSVRQVQRSLNELKEMGLVRSEKRSHTSNNYWINVDLLVRQVEARKNEPNSPSGGPPDLICTSETETH